MNYVVTTSIGRREDETVSRKEIWHSDSPLKVGHPVQWLIETTSGGVRITDLRMRNGSISQDRIHELTFEEIDQRSEIELKPGKHAVRLKFEPAAITNIKLPAIDIATDREAPFFKNALITAGIAIIAFILLSLVWPKPKAELELIPAQMAKIILTTPKRVASGAAEAAPAVQTQAQKKVQQTAVVQAFRAKALQNAVSGLMRGGMTKLLAQSDFVTGHKNNNESKRMFDTQSKDVKATASDIGDMNSKNVQVSALGGEGVPGANGKQHSVGYGHGEHAEVKGQGKGSVSMDIGNSSVEEGLTKDEVGEVIHRHLSEVRYCYESAMIRTPDIEGKLIVNFNIGGNGVVKTAEAKSSTLPDPRLDDCIIRRLMTWKFPNTKGGIDVGVTYPFIFKTLGR